MGGGLGEGAGSRELEGGDNMRFSEEANMQLNHSLLRLHLTTDRNYPVLNRRLSKWQFQADGVYLTVSYTFTRPLVSIYLP